MEFSFIPFYQHNSQLRLFRLERKQVTGPGPSNELYLREVSYPDYTTVGLTEFIFTARP